MTIIIMGVSGSGKTTIGKLLAEQLQWQFMDADDYHPASNIEKMKNAIPLNDDDRIPWLQELAQKIKDWDEQKKHTVLACSALKESYRQILDQSGPAITWVFLQGSQKVITERLQKRAGHFMSAQLLQSQFDTLELPTNALVIDITNGPTEIVRQICKSLNLA